MPHSLIYESDSIPFYLYEKVGGSANNIFNYDYSSFQFLPLDSTAMFYQVESFKEPVFSSAIEGILRPVEHQFSSVLFFLLALLFVVSSIIYKKGGGNLLDSFGQKNVLLNRKKVLFNQQLIVSNIWVKFFLIIQSIIICSVFFFVYSLQDSIVPLSRYDTYLHTYVVIAGALISFVIIKYLLYSIVELLFAKTKDHLLVDVYSWVICLYGILGFLPVVAYIYFPTIRFFAIISLIIIFILARIIVFITSFNFFMKLHIGTLSFFVYLCALEITPYLLMYKVAISVK